MTNYNPMSKEFQDECEKLGLTGNQLTVKYKKEGKSIEKDEIYKDRRSENKGAPSYTKNQLKNELIRYERENGRPPTKMDFTNNPDYPSFMTYIKHFGSWSNALKLVELDVESIVKKGIIETDDQKARFGEMIIRDHFEKYSVDLAGKNKKSPWDGVCPNGMNYDVKCSGLRVGGYYSFHTDNKHKDEIEIYYLLGFNENYTKLDYGWRIPGEIVESSQFYVGSNSSYKFNIENMKRYDITDELREVLIKYGLL